MVAIPLGCAALVFSLSKITDLGTIAAPSGSIENGYPRAENALCSDRAVFWHLRRNGRGPPKNEDKKPGDSPWSTGRTVLPENKGQLQRQGWTGPLSTESDGAPVESPQGGTPPPMQPAAAGSQRPSLILIPSPFNGEARGCQRPRETGNDAEGPPAICEKSPQPPGRPRGSLRKWR
jgi:hypothetical protein